MGGRGFAERLLAWYDQHGRHDLPWQLERSPYRVWVSEIMLQQTQVATVLGYFDRFITALPTVEALAAAEPDLPLALWSGLGYYSRARNLQRAARQLCDQHHGKIPTTLEGLMVLPGIGRSTAAAILSLAHDQRQTILDGNVKRVLARYHAVAGWPGRREVEKRLWHLAEHHTPAARNADYTQAIMDLGATRCTRSRPDCSGCPLHLDCAGYATGEPQRYPGAKPRKVLPTRHTRMLIIRNRRGEILLQRRPPTGIWGGLWSLPECDSEAAIGPLTGRVAGRMPAAIRPGTPFRHTFSHFHLEIAPLYIDLDEDRPGGAIMESGEALWYNTDSIQRLGLPAPVARLLAAITETTQEKMV